MSAKVFPELAPAVSPAAPAPRLRASAGFRRLGAGLGRQLADPMVLVAFAAGLVVSYLIG